MFTLDKWIGLIVIVSLNFTYIYTELITKSGDSDTQQVCLVNTHASAAGKCATARVLEPAVQFRYRANSACIHTNTAH